MTDRARPFSTKQARPIPPEFEPAFVAHGWLKVNHMFGKRAAVRYFTALGSQRLRAARDEHLSATRRKSAGHGWP